MADPGGLVSREFRAPLPSTTRGNPSGEQTVKLGQSLNGGTTALDALINDVDFPAFVAALIHGVFNAIVDASIPADGGLRRADRQSLRYERYDRLGQIDASAIVENKRLSHVLKAAAVLQAQRDNRRRSGTPSRTNQGQAPHPKRPEQGTKPASQFTSGDLERAVLATFARPEAPPPAKSRQRLFAAT